MPKLESLLRRSQRVFLYLFLGSAVVSVALGLLGIWTEMVAEGVFAKLLGSAVLLMAVSALGVSATRLMRE